MICKRRIFIDFLAGDMSFYPMFIFHLKRDTEHNGTSNGRDAKFEALASVVVFPSD